MIDNNFDRAEEFVNFIGSNNNKMIYLDYVRGKVNKLRDSQQIVNV